MDIDEGACLENIKTLLSTLTTPTILEDMGHHFVWQDPRPFIGYSAFSPPLGMPSVIFSGHGECRNCGRKCGEAIPGAFGSWERVHCWF